MPDRDMPKHTPPPPEPVKPDPSSVAENQHQQPGTEKLCGVRCERFADCRPDLPGWVLKKEAAAHLKTTVAALKQRAFRLGYASPAHNTMPRADQPKLCFDADYFILWAQARKKKCD